ncbi:hypothetical protein V3C99_014357 [Haemonchus contortus]
MFIRLITLVADKMTCNNAFVATRLTTIYALWQPGTSRDLNSIGPHQHSVEYFSACSFSLQSYQSSARPLRSLLGVSVYRFRSGERERRGT